MPIKDPEKRKAYQRYQSAKRYGPKRREYERQRKRRKRRELYESYPEPERSIALARLRGPYDIEFNRY